MSLVPVISPKQCYITIIHLCSLTQKLGPQRGLSVCIAHARDVFWFLFWIGWYLPSVLLYTKFWVCQYKSWQLRMLSGLKCYFEYCALSFFIIASQWYMAMSVWWFLCWPLFGFVIHMKLCNTAWNYILIYPTSFMTPFL